MSVDHWFAITTGIYDRIPGIKNKYPFDSLFTPFKLKTQNKITMHRTKLIDIVS